MIIIIFGELSSYINYFIEKENKRKSTIIITSIGLIIILFMNLIFIEIFEINYFGLNKITKKNIAIRASLESKIENDNDSVCSEGDYLINMENIENL